MTYNHLDLALINTRPVLQTNKKKYLFYSINCELEKSREYTPKRDAALCVQSLWAFPVSSCFVNFYLQASTLKGTCRKTCDEITLK